MSDRDTSSPDPAWVGAMAPSSPFPLQGVMTTVAGSTSAMLAEDDVDDDDDDDSEEEAEEGPWLDDTLRDLLSRTGLTTPAVPVFPPVAPIFPMPLHPPPLHAAWYRDLYWSVFTRHYAFYRSLLLQQHHQAFAAAAPAAEHGAPTGFLDALESTRQDASRAPGSGRSVRKIGRQCVGVKEMAENEPGGSGRVSERGEEGWFDIALVFDVT
ncbi:hypothetical protein HDU96_001110 [Phlyctochytrium bullatum]|nr:hypothetical protein HDU96_001110 [Phlyctochytrium bullatum]